MYHAKGQINNSITAQTRNECSKKGKITVGISMMQSQLEQVNDRQVQLGEPRLFHLTSPRESHLGRIIESGVILPLADVPALDGVVVAPHLHPEDVALDRLVWLTSAPWKSQGWVVDTPKGTVRIEIDPEAVNAIPWSEYAPLHFSPQYIALLNHPRFGDHRDWYVVEQEIPSTAWLGITHSATIRRPQLERRHVKTKRSRRRKRTSRGRS